MNRLPIVNIIDYFNLLNIKKDHCNTSKKVFEWFKKGFESLLSPHVTM